jgi:hypothetical protein
MSTQTAAHLNRSLPHIRSGFILYKDHPAAGKRTPMASDPRTVRADTIRWLLDRSGDYVKVSIRASILAALLGAAGSVATALWSNAASRPSYFLLVWALLGGVGALVVLYLLASAATRRGDPFLSRGFRLASACLLPSILASLAVLLLLSRTGIPPALLAPVLAVLYGSCLLSVAAFSPRPIVRLGWSFLVVGGGLLLALIGGYALQIAAIAALPAWISTAATFFLLHAIHPFTAASAAIAPKAD